MNILYLSASSRIGGAEAVLCDVLSCVRSSEPVWRLNVIAPSAGPLIDRVQAFGVATKIVPFPPALARAGDSAGITRALLRPALSAPLIAGYVAKLRAVVRESNCDIIHSNGFKMHLLGACVAGERPLIWHAHDYPGKRPVLRRVLRHVVSKCRGVIAVSESVAVDFRKVCRSRAPIQRIYNAVDLGRFSPDGPCEDLDSRCGLPPAPAGTIRVGLVATAAKWKGHAVFFRALSALPRTVPVRAYVVGGPVYETDGSQYSMAEMKQLAIEAGVSDVGFTGYIENPAMAIRALDIVVHASVEPEPFGMVIVEAMACGRPVIASNAGGAAEILSLTQAGFPHAPGSAEGLASQMLKLVADPDLRARSGMKGRVAVETHFGLPRFARELLPIYRGLHMRWN